MHLIESFTIIGQYQTSDVAIDCPDILLLRHAQLSICWVAHGRYAHRSRTGYILVSKFYECAVGPWAITSCLILCTWRKRKTRSKLSIEIHDLYEYR
jgi:hypothetical protein